MFSETAFAQAAAGGASDFQAQLTQFLPLILIAGVFYFLLIRPQQQRAKKLKEQVAAMRRGDKIITAGGIIASVSRVLNDEEVEVEIAAGVKVRVLRSTVTTVLAKTEPAGKGGKKDLTTTEIEDAIVEIDETSEANANADAAVKKRRNAKSKSSEAKSSDAKTTEAKLAEVKAAAAPKPDAAPAVESETPAEPKISAEPKIPAEPKSTDTPN